MKDSIVCLPFGGTWRQVGSDIDGKAEGDQFGRSVGMSKDGNTIVIGAPYNANTNGNSAGQVRVYSINSTIGNWQQIGSDINGKAAGNILGWSVCISEDGKTFATGATGNDNVNGVKSGHVLVYSYNATSNQWVQIGTDINGEAGYDQSGWSVDMSADGKRIVIGAPFNSNPNGVSSGHARVYTVNTTSGKWTQAGADIDGEAKDDSAGHSVAMSSDGNTIAVGAPDYDNANNADAGRVRVFVNNSTSKNWTQVGSDIYGKAARVGFGRSVALSSDGKTIAIGAPFNNNINSNVAGYVSVYSLNTTSNNWTQVGLDIDGVALGDQSGSSIAMSADGKTVAIGAPGYSNASGHVRVFSISSTSGTWTQVGLDINGEAVDDNSGDSVAISHDGFTLAIGSPVNDNLNPNGIFFVGQVRVYKYELPPTKAPTRMPTKSPTKPPTKFPTRRPTKSPSKTPTKFPTTKPTKTPTKRPTSISTKKPTKSPTKTPSQVILPVPIPIMVPIQVPSTTPVTVPTNCGLFGWNFFCPRRGECGFLRRLLNLRGC